MAVLTEKRVIEGYGHKVELAKVGVVSTLIPDAIHIGSTGLQLYLRDRSDSRISTRIAATQDADLVMDDKSLTALAKRLGAELEFFQLTASVTTRYPMHGAPTVTTVHEPFGLLRLKSEYQPTSDLFESIDIFTQGTRVGVIPVTTEVLASQETANIGGSFVRIAQPFFLMATQTNPFALTDQRAQRMLFLMLEVYANEGEAHYASQIGKTLVYLAAGGQQVKEIIAEHPELVGRREYADYDREVRRFAAHLTRMKNKMANAGGSIGLSAAETTRAREIAQDLYNEFRTPQADAKDPTLASLARVVNE